MNGKDVSVTDNGIDSSLLFFFEENLYLWQKPEDVNLVMKFHAKGKVTIAKENWQAELLKFVLPLTRDYHVEFDQSLISEVKDGEPEKRVVLQERRLPGFSTFILL